LLPKTPKPHPDVLLNGGPGSAKDKKGVWVHIEIGLPEDQRKLRGDPKGQKQQTWKGKVFFEG